MTATSENEVESETDQEVNNVNENSSNDNETDQTSSDEEYVPLEKPPKTQIHSTRSRPTRTKRIRIPWYNSTGEFIKISKEEQKKLNFDELNDYHVAYDDEISRQRSEAGKLRYKKKWEKQNPGKVYKGPKHLQKKPSPKVQYYINNGFKKIPSNAGKDIYYWRYMDTKETDQNLKIHNFTTAKRVKELSKMEFLIRPKGRSLHELQWYDAPTMKDREQGYQAAGTLATKEHDWQLISSLVPKSDLEIDIITEQDQYMYEKCYQYGVEPVWLKIDHVIGYNAIKEKYLVKWRDLPVIEATYEDEKTIPESEYEDFVIKGRLDNLLKIFSFIIFLSKSNLINLIDP